METGAATVRSSARHGMLFERNGQHHGRDWKAMIRSQPATLQLLNPSSMTQFQWN